MPADSEKLESSSASRSGSMSAGIGAAREQRRSLEREEHRASVLRFRVGLVVAVPLWVFFGVLDWVAVRYMGAGSLLLFWSLRFGLVPIALGSLWRLYRLPLVSPRGLRVIDIGLYSIAAFAIAVMAVDYGGIASRYPTGIMMILVARGAFSAQHWRRGLLPNLLVASSYPVVMGVAAPFSPGVAAELHDPAALGAGLHHLFFIYGTALLTLAGSHFAWTLRRQLSKAQSIGRYALRRRLGTGGMGEVWSAYHNGLQREVALKILKPEAAKDDTAVLRFEREVKATAELTHPNTVRVFDYGVTDDGIWYYAMELLSGETFGSLVRREGPLEPSRAVHLVSQAARSLAEAHALGIVHRDVKPANLFVTTIGGETDFVKVLDFGIAKLADGEAGLTRVGEVAGTPKFMAPEVVRGEGATPASDVYGLGGVLYTLLAGRPPFEAEQASAVYLAQLTEAPMSPSEKRGGPLPAELERIVMRCLEKEARARYASAAELADALANLDLSWRPRRSQRPPAPDADSAPASDVATVIAPTAVRRPTG